jgi:DNA-binding GntR family transcriptional regulator
MTRNSKEEAPSVGSARQLADRLTLRIRGGDLPAGTRLEPALIAALHGVPVALVEEALALLETAADTSRDGEGWCVSDDRPRGAREIMIRAQPALVAIARLAAERITPEEAAALEAARCKLVGLAGDGSPQSRADGYREFMLRLAEASGSEFLLGAVRRLLREGAAMVDALARMDMLLNPVPRADGELNRLVRAIDLRDAEAAAHAMEDHAILISHQLDAMTPT